MCSSRSRATARDFDPPRFSPGRRTQSRQVHTELESVSLVGGAIIRARGLEKAVHWARATRTSKFDFIPRECVHARSWQQLDTGIEEPWLSRTLSKRGHSQGCWLGDLAVNAHIELGDFTLC